MKLDQYLSPHIEYVFAEELPSDSSAVQESEDRGLATLDRIYNQRMDALKKGIIITHKPKGLDKHFIDPGIPKKEGLRSIKMRELEPLELKK